MDIRIWLTRARLVLLAGIFAGLNLIAVALMLLTSHSGLDSHGRPLGTDFIALWSAGWLALTHNIALANGSLPFSAIHPLAPAGQTDILLWNYPPPILLIAAPLALLAYVPALAVFVSTSLAAAISACRLFSRDRLALIILLGAPATLLSVLSGQNGLLIAAITLSGLVLLPARPLVAGSLLGLLVIKPHFIILLPFFLLLRAQYKALAALLISAIGLCLLSWLMFGSAPWQLFFDNAGSARLILEQGAPPWSKMGSAFVSARELGASVGTAWIIHAVVSALGVWLAWPALRQKNDHLAGAALLVLSFVLMPYQFDYDMVLLIAALGLWSRCMTHWHRTEQTTMALLWLGPLLTVPLAMQTSIGILPLVLLWTLVLLRARAWEQAPHSPAG